ncbi:hypothetical protein CPTMiller_00181 [Citrobacter phage Miller]|uniref:Uncharacterized protein n=1 Tax=Citrobacter phage Miller TaxID=1527524 RepID=A0A076YK03_9CAUD|nr:hypothetical protein CPTMiller_00181 [Citrobacter phage Miller]AIK68117.1 hypothetical protein CPTMiller_00181 [Citrobacter phage Miller]
MSKPTTFQICQMIMLATATRAAEPIAYSSWDYEFAIKHIRDLPNRLIGSPDFSPVDPNELTLEEMKNLGFRKWSDKTNLMLIPLYLLPYLKEGITVIDISDEQYYFFREEADNDHRMGLLAFGVVPKA